MLFSIAAALADGEVNSDTFEDGRFLDDDILAIISKMSVEINPDYSKQAPGLRNCRIEAVLETGETVISHRALSQAEIEKETPDAVINAKFHGLTRRVLPPSTRQALAAEIAKLDALESIDSILELMVI